MLGHPKFQLNDIVIFTLGGEEIKGKIYIIDAYGTFFKPDDVSYDIMDIEERVLYKHIPESCVKKFDA